MTIRTKERRRLLHELGTGISRDTHPGGIAFHTVEHGFGVYPLVQTGFPGFEGC